MRIISGDKITQTVTEMIKAGLCGVTQSASVALQRAIDQESGAARYALEMLKENAEMAAKNNFPVCQDTGMAVFFAEVGQELFIEGNLIEAINEGVRKAYVESGFRFSVLDPIDRVNTKDNTPAVVHIDIVSGDKLKLSFLPKGFGSENMSKLYMLAPSAGTEGIIDCIVRCAAEAKSNPCPPIVVGVGIGGTCEKAMEVAKRQLLREVGKPSDDAALAEIEQAALERINALNIGPQGFGGKNTAYAVHAGKFPTHISALPIAVNIQCNAVRMSEREL